MVTSIKRVATQSPIKSKGTGRTNGNGHHPPGPERGGGYDREPAQESFSPAKYRIGMWVALAAIMMMFTALVSSYVILASSTNWRTIPFPTQLWLSTALIVGSSWTFKKSIGYLKQRSDAKSRQWLWVTLGLGIAFLGSQFLAWKQLMALGIALAGNARALFYVLTGVHAAHIIGGLLALGYLLLRNSSRDEDVEIDVRRQTSAEVVGLYWHFMDGLWVVLFLLLLLWR